MGDSTDLASAESPVLEPLCLGPAIATQQFPDEHTTGGGGVVDRDADPPARRDARELAVRAVRRAPTAPAAFRGQSAAVRACAHVAVRERIADNRS